MLEPGGGWLLTRVYRGGKWLGVPEHMQGGKKESAEGEANKKSSLIYFLRARLRAEHVTKCIRIIMSPRQQG